MTYLIDVDGTLTVPNTEEFLNDTVKDAVNKIYDEGNEVWLYTCRPYGEWIKILRDKGLKFTGYHQKPFTETGYVFFDDKFVYGNTKIV